MNGWLMERVRVKAKGEDAETSDSVYHIANKTFFRYKQWYTVNVELVLQKKLCMCVIHTCNKFYWYKGCVTQYTSNKVYSTFIENPV